LCSLHFTQQFLGITADAQVIDFRNLDDAFWVDNEGTAQRQSFLLDQYAEIAADEVSRIAKHGVLNFLDRLRRVMPRLVGEMRIGRHAVNLHAELLELWIEIRHVAQFGRTHEGEVGGIEEKHRPLAFQIRLRHWHELAIVVSGGLERFDGRIDH
jgi:hypothetical protein